MDASFLLGRRAVRLDVEAHAVDLDDGRQLQYGRLVLATGLAPRRLPGTESLRGVRLLRTLDDCVGLRADLLASRRVVVVGAGVLGCEIAATVCQMGRQVTMIDPAPVPMARQTGLAIGRALSGVHTDHGVEMRMGTSVKGLLSEHGRVTGVEIDGGEVVAADVIVTTIGSVPVTDWLIGSGLSLDDGVLCDERGRAGADIYAVGDVARWSPGRIRVGPRVENRTNAVQQAVFVASDITGAQGDYDQVPYFWTDQYDIRMQVFGLVPEGAYLRLIEGALPSRKFVMVAEQEGQVVGVVGWNSAKAVMAAKQAHLG
ncbi:NAD(P)/FAD-dependent oxidoreductase [Streptomyces sp. NPDC051362]|uniref:NAD(P)/FAD-dependent oxidoreductase n=1 Tax=Streptomyces sp. NPDC051362 TaxID=3365651 RepID=UPI00379C609D